MKTRVSINLGRWFPIAKTLVQRCCRCGAKHTAKFRVRKNGELEMMVKP